MDKEVKIKQVDNGYLLVVIDLDAETRMPINKLVAQDLEQVKNVLVNIYKKK